MYKKLGPGLLESAYEAALKFELEKAGFSVQSQICLPMIYENIRVEAAYRLDLVVNQQVVIETKAVEALLNVHHKQLITYLKRSGYPVGLLVNFNGDDILKNIFRKLQGNNALD